MLLISSSYSNMQNVEYWGYRGDVVDIIPKIIVLPLIMGRVTKILIEALLLVEDL